MGEEKKSEREKELKEQITALEEKVKKLEELAKAGNERYLNLRKELEFLKEKHRRELEELKRYCLEHFVKDLLEVADNFERALEHLRGNDRCKETLTGIEMIYNQLKRVLEKHGVTPIEVEKFDHALCEAVSTVPTDEVEENTIVQVVQKGYKLHDRVVRPAKVVVAIRKEDKREGEG
jgi:molecular chaperone GrpE